MARHPMQPVQDDGKGVWRFKPNAIVKWLLETGPANLNDIARRGFPAEDQEQFAQLIGYSVSGFGDLPYASGENAELAQRIVEGTAKDTEDARNEILREMLATTRAKAREAIEVLGEIAGGEE